VKHPCVFKNPIIRKEINPKLHAVDPETPYAAFQKIFRSEHCATLNPYGSESCPYPPEQCAAAYYQDAVRTMVAARRKTRIGYFRKVTRTSASIRADAKPLARDTRTDGHERAEGLRAGPGAGPVDDLPKRSPGDGGLYRPIGRPERIGSLFGANDVRPRVAARGGDEGEAATHHAGDRFFRLRESPPLDELGDGSSPADPGVHQEGE